MSASPNLSGSLPKFLRPSLALLTSLIPLDPPSSHSHFKMYFISIDGARDARRHGWRAAEASQATDA